MTYAYPNGHEKKSAIAALREYGLSAKAAEQVWTKADGDWRRVCTVADEEFGKPELATRVRDALRFVDALKLASLARVEYHINSPKLVAELVEPLCTGGQEHLIVVVFNSKMRVMHYEVVYRGTVTSAGFRNAEVLRPAVLANAPSFICVHNHPSGNATPSTDDLHVNRNLIQAAELLDIDLLDHIIIGRGQFYSMREHAVGGF